ncbi:hypothetical protein BaRGS_00031093 [Batillaria attramentaria]|uniref:Uncharacterized protein n=1 Tax=Batillaria attramentaria TaxID=370345 RepID=A0ABD0JRV1_9CAEN
MRDPRSTGQHSRGAEVPDSMDDTERVRHAGRDEQQHPPFQQLCAMGNPARLHANPGEVLVPDSMEDTEQARVSRTPPPHSDMMEARHHHFTRDYILSSVGSSPLTVTSNHRRWNCPPICDVAL